MSTTLIALFALSAGIVVGFVLCALLSANGRNDDREAADARRLNFLIDNNLSLFRAEGLWSVLGHDRRVIRMAPEARYAIDAVAEGDLNDLGAEPEKASA